MRDKKLRLGSEVQAKIAEFGEWAATHPVEYRAALANGMTGCVFTQQISPQRHSVGWRFTKAGTRPGEVQQDCHNSFSRDQVILWVSEMPTFRGIAAGTIITLRSGEKVTTTGRGNAVVFEAVSDGGKSGIYYPYMIAKTAVAN